jgi:hypothetical protein
MNARLNLSGSPLAARAMKCHASASTRIADAGRGVLDESWANAAKHYDEEQLAAPVHGSGFSCVEGTS